ncbi:hypothetical protein MCEREM21A_00614 [Sphingomonadaceae bacterium]
MSKKFNFVVVSYIIFFILSFSTINFDEKFDNELSIFLKNYNIIYNSEYPYYVVVIYLSLYAFALFSSIAMLFRVRYSHYIFVCATLIGYSIYIFELDTISVSTMTEDLYASLSIFFEGALVALIMFHDDIGFKKGADEIV